LVSVGQSPTRSDGIVLGSINHVALTVTNLESALPFFDGFLGFLGYERGKESLGSSLRFDSAEKPPIHEHSG
jgi:catechol 2,3-dioxygenase-like lactoylglutathione lyase family enzyme